MSDLPPAERPTPPRARRAARPKSRSAAARRANRPSAALNGAASADELLPVQPKEASTDAIGKAVQKATASQAEPEVVEPAGDRVTIRVRGLTLLSKQILLWASIIGVINLALSIGTNFFISALGSTKAQAAQNAGLLNGGFCLSLALVLAVLPFIAGWRATLREGTWKEGGITGVWSVIVSEVLGLIVAVILAAIQGQLAQINGDYFTTLLGDLVVPVVLSFSFGAAGGYYNIWQRRRAERRQEALTSSS